MNHSIPFFSRCSHFGQCAGCSEYLSLEPPPIWEEVLSFFNFSSPPTLHVGSPVHWRHRAKMAIRGTFTHPQIGLFKRNSHEVFSIPLCLVHHPHLNQAFEIVRKWMQMHALIPYEEKTRQGELRYLQGVVQRSTGQVQLAFVFNSSSLKKEQVRRWHALVEQLGKEHSTFWHSLWINFNDRPVNTIFGQEWRHVWGEEQLWEQFGEVAVCYGPASFGQANLPLFERMLNRICELLPHQARVAEFYAGVGAIGLCISPHCQWVRCSEMNPFAETYFQQARAQMSSHLSSRLTFFSGTTQDTLSLLEDATTAIVDPPRKGLHIHFFSALKDAQTVRQLLYISCGWESFKQDCQKLCEEGWKVQSVDGYHFFPGSNHIELLVHFER